MESWKEFASRTMDYWLTEMVKMSVTEIRILHRPHRTSIKVSNPCEVFSVAEHYAMLYYGTEVQIVRDGEVLLSLVAPAFTLSGTPSDSLDDWCY